MSRDAQTSKPDDIVGGLHRDMRHDDAGRHVTGSAVYIDDIREPDGTLHVHPVRSMVAHARVTRLDLSAVAAAEGVAAVLTHDDIPGTNDFSHGQVGDDRVFAGDLVEYAGQVLFAVVATSIRHARKAAKRAVVDYEILEPVLTIEDAMRQGSFHEPPRCLSRGDSTRALAGAAHRLSGRISNGAQEHFYLEGQVALAVPREEGDMLIYSSTQDPTAVQHIVARIRACSANAVTVETRRMGGGFGGKETMPTHFAAIAALAADKCGVPVKCCLDRDDDMIITGKRHEFFSTYDVGFDAEGLITGLELELHVRCGHSLDQSSPVINRAIFHCDNCYFLEHVTITGFACKTNTVTAVAFRGFGTPQGMLIVERVLDHIACHLGLDPLNVRKRNFYGKLERNTTPFDAPVEDNILPELVAELEGSSDYVSRREQVAAFNRGSRWLKKGIAFTPIKYGVGFGVNFLNQAGALLHVYQDGSVHLNHGGTEMGQGLFVKVAQVVADELQIDIDRIKTSATSTDKVPNTTATAASSGTDLNAAAAKIAASTIRGRLIRFASEHFSVDENRIVFLPNRVRVGNQEIAFDTLIELAYLDRVALSATGHYKAPPSNYDPVSMKGQPHRYYVFGAAVCEVTIDILTGEYRVNRVDILHDVGKSLNPAVDLGQLEGGFIQGMGWLTTEEVVWDDEGVLRTHAPSTYKIPTCSDRPADVRMQFVEGSENRAPSVSRSKAIGEPPLCLAISVFAALTDAVGHAGARRLCPELNAPATPEAVLLSVEKVMASHAA